MARIKHERSWLASTTPASLLATLKGKRIPRQRRLIAVACCRRYFDMMKDPESRQAVETAERYADGEADTEELQQAFLNAQRVATSHVMRAMRRRPKNPRMSRLAWSLVYAAQLCCGRSGAEGACRELLRRARWQGPEVEKQEKRAQCQLIRDIMGNPFRELPRRVAEWRTANDGAVTRLTEAIYHERRFQDLPILADALEEAGCTDAVVLDHCREPGLHARGCWVIDWLTGRR